MNPSFEELRPASLLGYTLILAIILACILTTPFVTAAADGDLATLRARYTNWVLGDASAYDSQLATQRLETAIREARRAMSIVSKIDFTSPAALYDTTKRGQDDAELYRLITDVLPALSIAYHLPGSAQTPNPWFHDGKVKDAIFKVFDRLHARGFRHPMHLPWKAAQVKQRDPKQAFIVDFILRVAGYPLATFLMREELRATGRLDSALATCWEIESHPEKVGNMRALFLEADAVRVVLNLSLPAALAEGNIARLEKLKAQLDRSMLPESSSFDTIKPDGLGHHHRGVYADGYATFTVAQAAFAAWLFQGTTFACSGETVDHVAGYLEALRVMTQKFEAHQALSGRFPGGPILPSVMLGYAYLADLDHPRKRQFQQMFARLADDAYLASELPRRTFQGHRNEVPPGPGAIAFFMRTLHAARSAGAEEDPQGNWSFNFGPMMVHRRSDWMVSIKGYSQYWWAFERSLTDARKDARQENVLGFHDGSASLQIFGQGRPWINSRDSGYRREGWDWCRVPGTTTRYLTPDEMLAMDKGGQQFNRPFSDRAFVGGVTLEGKNGLFVMDYMEAAPDRRKTPLRAMKSAFFFEDQIVALTTGIRDGDGIHTVGTTLFQTALSDPAQTTFAQGKPMSVLSDKGLIFGNGPSQFVDAAGNGYYVPDAQKVVFTRREQSSLDESATKITKGNFATAWIDHGPSPVNASCEYVILVRSGEKSLADFASRASQEYRVLRRDETAHIVMHLRLGLTGYAIAKGKVPLGDSFIEEAGTPCLVMMRKVNASEVSLSVCNPDLGWTPGVQFRNRDDRGDAEPMKPIPMPVTLTVKGKWSLKEGGKAAVATVKGEFTQIEVACEDGQGIEFSLRSAKP